MTIFGRLRKWGFVVAMLGGALSPALASDTGTNAIPFKQDKPAGEVQLNRVVTAFVLCVGGLAAVLYVVRRRGNNPLMPRRSPREIRIVETQRLSPRSSLHIIEYAGKRMLLAEGPQGVSRIDESNTPLENV